MTPNTVSAWELMSPTEHAVAYTLFAALGIIFLFALYKIATDPKENQRVRERMQQEKHNRPTEAQQQTRLLRNLFWLTFFTRRR